MSNLKINIVLFGIRNVGNALVNKVIESQFDFHLNKNIDIRFPIITNSKLAYFEKEGVDEEWASNFILTAVPYKIEDIFEYVKSHNLENLIAVDVTDSDELVKNYIPLIENGFHIVAANKNANTFPNDFYKELRSTLEKHNKTFLYETNVGSGFPVIQTIRDLHFSGEKITKIRGVFSETISYIFNRFSSEETAFSSILEDVERLELTKLDFPDYLTGIQEAKKILILAREIGNNLEFSDIAITTLIPPDLDDFNSRSKYGSKKELFDQPYKIAKLVQNDNHVLRYVGEFSVLENKLEVQLVSEPITSPIGQLKGTETIFEIYTQSYGKIPIVIQGLGAGKQALARGVLTDVLKVVEKIKTEKKVLA
jgi:homoserine dehydrogenase